MLTHDLLARVRDLPKWHRITVSGKGSQTVVLANGFGTDQTFWRGLLPWLEERFRVVRFDWLIDPDHFDSSRYKSLEGFAEDLLAIQMATDAAPCLYVGQSMGAMVGMLAARRRPDFFRSMVMLAPSPCFINHPGYRGGFDQEGIDALLGQIGHDYMEWVKSFSPLVVAAPPSHQDAQEFARCLMALRPDVVKITATPGRDAVPQTGFGFIVSQQGSELVVVTADHVVRGAGGPQEGDIGLGVLDPLHNGTKSGFCGGATPSPSERSSGHSRRAAGTG